MMLAARILLGLGSLHVLGAPWYIISIPAIIAYLWLWIIASMMD